MHQESENATQSEKINAKDWAKRGLLIVGGLLLLFFLILSGIPAAGTQSGFFAIQDASAAPLPPTAPPPPLPPAPAPAPAPTPAPSSPIR